jgi:hypothetical protein
MPDIEVDIELFCARCGEGICNNATAKRTRIRSQPCFEIEPCEKCLSNAEDKGYQRGYEEAQNEV